MDYKKIEDEFDKKNSQFQYFGTMTNGEIKQFYRQKIREWAIGCVGEDEDTEYAPAPEDYRRRLLINQAKAEIRAAIIRDIPEK
jgi:hypothetical protein